MMTRLSRLPAWVGVALALGLLTAHLGYYAYIEVDDAYILYRYARNLARGDGLLYNPGHPPVEGYSSFLWVAILAGIARLGLDIPVTAKIISGALSMLTLIGVAFVLHQSGASKYAIWGACAWTAASGSYAMWTLSGLESALVAALAILSLIQLAGEDRLGCGVASGFSLALLALARAEGAIFFVAALATRAVARLRGQSSRPRREDVKWFLTFAMPFGAYLMWRISYYGDWLPNTVYVKAGGGYIYHALRGAHYLFQFLTTGGALLTVLIFAAVLLRAAQPFVRQAVAGSAFYIALITIAGGDWMLQFRFFAPILPWLSVLAAIGLEALAKQWKWADQRHSIVFAGLIAVLIGGLFIGTSIQAQEIDRSTRDFSAPVAGGHVRAAWLRQNSKPGDSIALVDAGVLAFETELHIIDMIGLNDDHIAHLPPKFPRGLAPGNGFGKWDVDYVLNQQPTFIQVHLSRERWEQRDLRTDWVGTDALINDPRFLAKYEYISDPRIGGIFQRIDR